MTGQLFAAILSPALLRIVGVFFVAILVAAHIIWLLERRRNPDFSHGYWSGIWESIWWASVTVTTVGYGDKTPKDHLGRLFALVWMFTGLFLIANFTAGVTTVVTLQKMQGDIRGLADLADKRVVTVEGSTAAHYLHRLDFQPVLVEQIDDAFKLLETDVVQAIVYDAPVLMYYAANHNADGDLQLVGQIFNKEDYGIALPIASPYRESINQALLGMIGDGSYQELERKWFQ